MNAILLTDEAAAWINNLVDVVAKARVLSRIEQAKGGNFGDCAPVGEGVSEMRIHHGPGYRLYLKRVGAIVYLVLCAGTKGTQKSDIAKARKIANDL